MQQCRIKNSCYKGWLIGPVSDGIMLVGLTSGGYCQVPADQVEMEHTRDESRSPVNPCVGQSVQEIAVTTSTTTTQPPSYSGLRNFAPLPA
jgi:hypothetical protein